MSVVWSDYFGRTDVGRSRQRNEDAYFTGQLASVEGWTLLAVADGLGGHVKGDWASHRTLELLASGLDQLIGALGPLRAMEEACRRVNWAVFSEARAMGAYGAATTLVAALVHADQVWWMNVGDSRFYVLSGGALGQVSHDHSWVAEQVDIGALTPEDARVHPNRNVVTRTVGFEPSVSIDVGGPIALAPGDALLLCSDGLFGPVGDKEIVSVMAGHSTETACKRLIAAANAAGGPDNITVVVGRLGETTGSP